MNDAVITMIATIFSQRRIQNYFQHNIDSANEQGINKIIKAKISLEMWKPRY